MKRIILLICMLLIVFTGCNEKKPQLPNDNPNGNPIETVDTINVGVENENDLKYTIKHFRQQSAILLLELNDGKWERCSSCTPEKINSETFEMTIIGANSFTSAENKDICGINVNILFEDGSNEFLNGKFTLPEGTIVRICNSFSTSIKNPNSDEVLLGYVAVVPREVSNGLARPLEEMIDMTKDYYEHPEEYEYGNIHLFAVVYKY